MQQHPSARTKRLRRPSCSEVTLLEGLSQECRDHLQMQASSHSCRSYVHLTDFDIHEEHDLLRWKLETAKGGGCSGLPPVIGTASGTVCFVGACCLQNVSCQGAPLGCPSSRRRILSCAIHLGFRPAQACICLHKLAVKASHASAPCCRSALHIAGRLRHLQCRCRHLQHWVCMPDAKHGVRSAVRMPRHWPVQELCCVGAQGPAAGYRCSRGARCMSRPCSHARAAAAQLCGCCLPGHGQPQRPAAVSETSGLSRQAALPGRACMQAYTC